MTSRKKKPLFIMADDTEEHYSDYDQSKIVVIPIPFEETITWQEGTKNGPEAIIRASKEVELYDIETQSMVYQQGISTLEPVIASTPSELVKLTEDNVLKQLNRNKFLVILGGEHLVAIGAIKAYAKKIKNLSLLHLDAHTDLRPEWEGSKLNNACVIARAKESVSKVVSVGIRSVGQEDADIARDSEIFYDKDLHSNNLWIENVLEKLTDNVYVTIDLDVFDPALVPAVGTPEPGGLGWYQMIELFRKLTMKKNLVGFDVTELKPIADEKSSDFIVAKLIYTILSYKFSSHHI